MTFPLRSLPNDRDPKIQNSNEHDSPLSLQGNEWRSHPLHQPYGAAADTRRVDVCECVTRDESGVRRADISRQRL